MKNSINWKMIKIILFTAMVSNICYAQIIYHENDTEILVSRTYPYFTIALAFDPFCGGNWNLHAYDSTRLLLIKEQFVPNKDTSNRVGSQLFTFKVFPAAFQDNNAAMVTLQFGYHWETDSSGTPIYYHIRMSD